MSLEPINDTGDSSVWIDYFNGVDNPYTAKLDSLLGVEFIAIDDIILAEMLQKFHSDKYFKTAKSDLLRLTIFDMLSQFNAHCDSGKLSVLKIRRHHHKENHRL